MNLAEYEAALKRAGAWISHEHTEAEYQARVDAILAARTDG